jgi:hypothetical protein
MHNFALTPYWYLRAYKQILSVQPFKAEWLLFENLIQNSIALHAVNTTYLWVSCDSQ